MGIIQKQAVRTTTIIFAGLIFGVISRLSMPFVLSKEEIGALTMLDSVSNLFAAFASLGFAQIVYRTYAGFRKDENQDSGLLRFALMLSLVGAILGGTIYLLTRSFIFGLEGEKAPLADITIFIAIVLICKVLFRNIDVYLRMSFRSVIGAFMESFVLKLIIITGILLLWLEFIDFRILTFIYVVGLCAPGITMLFLALKNPNRANPISGVFATRESRQAILRNGLFGVLMTGSGILVLTIDQVMLVNMLTLEDVGVYSVLFFAGMIVNVPSRGIKRISAAVIGKAWAQEDLQELENIYHKTHITNFLAGVFLLCIGWLCLDDALFYLPDYAYGKYVFLFIGLGQLIEMSTGANQEIIASSSKYEYNTYLAITMGVLICLSNYFLIPDYGISGAAFASFLTILFLNVLRLWIAWKLFGIQPFNGKSAKALLASMPLVFLAIWDPLTWHPFLNMVTYFMVGLLIFSLAVYKGRVNEDTNQFIDKLLRWAGLKKTTP